MSRKSKIIVQWIVLFVASFCFNLVFSGSTTPLYRSMSIDSAIFQEIGLAILHGKIPYTEIFDHKGLYLYLIDALGFLISQKWGLLLLQSLCHSLCLILIIRIQEVLIQDERNYRIISTLCVLLFFFCIIAFEGGNTTEDWSLPFVLLPMLFCVSCICNKTFYLSFLQIFYLGTCCGIVFFLRMNNVFPLVCFVLVILAWNIKYKKYGYILKGILCGLSGILIGILPCFVFMYNKGGWNAIDDMLYATFTYNFLYATNHEYGSLVFVLKSFIPALFFMSLPLLSAGKNRIIVYTTSASIVLGMLVIGKALLRHYFLLFIPLFIISFLIISKHERRCFLTCITFLLMSIASINPILRYIEDWRTNSYGQRSEQFKHVLAHIPPEERDKVWNYNLITGMDLFVSNDMVQMNHCTLRGLERNPGTDRKLLYDNPPEWILLIRRGEIPDEAFLRQIYVPIDSTDVTGNPHNVVLLKKL